METLREVIKVEREVNRKTVNKDRGATKAEELEEVGTTQVVVGLVDKELEEEVANNNNKVDSRSK
jgi:hypothetical protein